MIKEFGEKNYLLSSCYDLNGRPNILLLNWEQFLGLETIIGGVYNGDGLNLIEQLLGLKLEAV